MEQFIDLLKEVNIAQIFIILSAGWMGYSRLDKKIEKIDEKSLARYIVLDNDLHRLQNDMIEVKTILRMKECCMINDDRQSKKAE